MQVQVERLGRVLGAHRATRGRAKALIVGAGDDEGRHHLGGSGANPDRKVSQCAAGPIRISIPAARRDGRRDARARTLVTKPERERVPARIVYRADANRHDAP